MLVKIGRNFEIEVNLWWVGYTMFLRFGGFERYWNTLGLPDGGAGAR
jgi:hypothetical protein